MIRMPIRLVVFSFDVRIAMPSESGFGASDGILLGFFGGCDGYCATWVGGIEGVDGRRADVLFVGRAYG
ncbi:hypothetical protein BN1095_4290001 [Clostridioides difficile]|uniref:Uncharacterized protein n=1 Tax=Clostridioides difficile TaxID=1496 RepID=A0A069APZ9_CLODI|nr:hypothetical protein BN1095_4290001 [Clostridioides difficile]